MVAARADSILQETRFDSLIADGACVTVGPLQMGIGTTRSQSIAIRDIPDCPRRFVRGTGLPSYTKASTYIYTEESATGSDWCPVTVTVEAAGRSTITLTSHDDSRQGSWHDPRNDGYNGCDGVHDVVMHMRNDNTLYSKHPTAMLKVGAK